MSDRPLDERYFDWLYRQVGSGRKTHTKLLEKLFCKEFVWHVPNDDNRAVDGQELRPEFLHDEGITNPPEDWMWLGCSMLELLVALSRRLAYEADGEPSAWFWELIRNIDLYQYSDRYRFPLDAIDEALDRIIWRRYESDGRGGLFPLQYPKEDQREVEIWYQMCAYLLEQAA